MILSLPFVGTLIDIGGMWLTRFASPKLAFLVIDPEGGTRMRRAIVLTVLAALLGAGVTTERTSRRRWS